MKTFGLGVKLLIIDKETKQFLAIARNADKKLHVPEKWDIPGGRLEIGEEPLAALLRELSEEIGYSLPTEPSLVDAANIVNNDERQIVRLTYAVEDISKNVSIALGDEHSAATWLPIQPSDEFHPCLNQAIMKYVQRQGVGK